MTAHTDTIMANQDMGTMILNHETDSNDGTMIINSGTMIGDEMNTMITINSGTMIENMGTMVINDGDDSTMKSKFYKFQAVF